MPVDARCYWKANDTGVIGSRKHFLIITLKKYGKRNLLTGIYNMLKKLSTFNSLHLSYRDNHKQTEF